MARLGKQVTPLSATGLLRAGRVLFASGLIVPMIPAQADDASARQRQLTELLANDCGACHGLTRRGGLGSPLTADALRDKDDEGLALTILDGRPGTPMPPWRPFISESEARWLVELLKRSDGTSTP